MAQVEEDIRAEGVQIIWVLEQSSGFVDGTAQLCRDVLDGISDVGYCVGDGQTMPTPGVFDDSNLAIGRGFNALVRRSDMVILFESSHGTPSGNENLTGPELLDIIRGF